MTATPRPTYSSFIISTVGVHSTVQYTSSPSLKYRLPPLDWTRRAHPTRSPLPFSLHYIPMPHGFEFGFVFFFSVMYVRLLHPHAIYGMIT